MWRDLAVRTLLLLSLSLGSCAGGGSSGTGGLLMRGTIFTSDGIAIEGAQVTFVPASGEPSQQVTSDAAGVFELSSANLSLGSLQIDPPGEGEIEQIAIEYPSGAELATVVVDVDPLGQVAASVVYEDVVLTQPDRVDIRAQVETEIGAPIDEAQVSIVDASGEIVAEGETNADGELLISDIPIDEGTIVIELPAGETGEVDFSVPESSDEIMLEIEQATDPEPTEFELNAEVTYG